MFDSPFDPCASETVYPSIFLDYGADGVAGEDAACEICERGMRFRSCWRFEQGAALKIAFSFDDGTPRRMEAEGAVAECCPDGDRRYVTTLVFLDLPDELRSALRKKGNRVVATPARPPRSICP